LAQIIVNNGFALVIVGHIVTKLLFVVNNGLQSNDEIFFFTAMFGRNFLKPRRIIANRIGQLQEI
jgi:hypothetical protein